MTDTTKKTQTLEQIHNSEAKVGMVFACRNSEDLKKYKERRKAEIIQKRSLIFSGVKD